MKHIVTRISLLFLWACIGFGQEFRATLQGTITDPTQAAIPGAIVTLHNNDTAIERKTIADGSGFYMFQFVTPGSYSLMVSASGFRNNVQEHIVLTVSQDARQDVKLELGAASETVSVVSDVALIQPESSTLGYAVNTDTIDVLPVKGHSSLMVYNLSPGMLSTRIGEDARPNDTATNMMFGVSGAPMATSDVAVDGVPNTVDINRGAVLAVWVPALSSVAELKVQSGTLPAEYGFSAGSFVNVVIKSGTNDLHGSAYEYLKNSKMDADLFFARGLGQPLAASAANTFGGSIGGPVYLPKLYNGRNRSFFFVDYEGSREGTANNAISTVPTVKMRNGDFSEVPNAIYNPYSTQNVGGTWVRAPFPGNIIPPLVQDPVGRSIMTYYPLPNITASNPAAPWASDYSFSSKFPRSYNMWVVKGDYMVSSRDQAFVRVNYGTAYILYPTSFDGIAAPAKQVDYRPHSGVAVGNTYSLSGHTTLDVRLGWARGWEKFVPYSQGFNASKTLGLPGYFENMVQDPAFPTVAVTSFLGLSGTWDYVEPGDTYSLQGSVSMQRGKHLFKTGGDSRLIRGSFFANQNPGGIFNFGLTQTAGPNVYTPAVGTGFGMASLMVGYGSGGSVDVNPALAIQNFYYGLFFEDNYRVSHKLTLNYGIRYEYESPRTERFNRTTHGFAYNTPSPLQVPGLNLQGGLIYAGVNSQPRGLYTPDRNNFAPRIGFAYSLTNKIVLRGGYALSYIPMISLVQPTGFSVSTPWVPTTDSLTFTAPLSNPYPGGPLRAIGNSQGLLTLLGQNVAFIDPGDHTPRFHNWQFNVQRQFPSQTLIEIGYVGSRTIGTFGGLDNGIVPTVDVNQMNPQYLSQGAALLQQVPNPFYGTITSGALSGTTVQQMQLLKPYPQFTGVTRMYPAIGNVIYHSMQLQMQKRMANGVTAVIAYTVSKNINDLNTAQNAYDRQASRSVGRWDIPQRLTTSIAWQLPFGRKRLLLGNASRALDTAIGGWELSVFNTFQSGLPLAFSLARATLGANGNRPNVVGNPATGVSGSIESHLNHYFNTSAFVQPPDFTFGNVSPFVGSVRAPGMNAIDTTLSKTFPITERLKLEFRCSAYNLPNHPVFSAPNTSFGDPNFGRVTGQANFGREMEFALRLVF